MKYDTIIVGAGISGLTAAAYLSKEGHKVLLCEKQDYVGGLVNSFQYKDFTFEGGIRAIEDSGIVQPMLRQLGIDIEFLPSTVSLGLEDEVIQVKDKSSLKDYADLLKRKFPDNEKDINRIIKEISKIMKYMDILYGLDNPAFFDIMKNKKYLFGTVLPWLFKFLFTINKVEKLNEPVDEYLKKFTDNQSLIDVIGQHFFYKTPAFFALSYFSLYLDYAYPKGGTGTLTQKIKEFFLSHGGVLKLETDITYLNPEAHIIKDSIGNEYEYENLIWASDNRYLYEVTDTTDVKDTDTLQSITEKKQEMSKKKGGDSILTVYMTVDLPKQYFREICTGHFFYTPDLHGLDDLVDRSKSIRDLSKEEVIEWLKDYYKYNTFEVAIPSLRDESLAPKGKTGLIVSLLFDYEVTSYIKEQGWYEEFKKMSEEVIINILDKSIFPGLESKVIDKFTSTPLTIVTRTRSSHGAITGWAFTNKPVPSEKRMLHVSKASLTPIPDVFQSGQWSFSPSGMPIAILTGKLAADRVDKILKKKKH